jgi:hypothetical protein
MVTAEAGYHGAYSTGGYGAYHYGGCYGGGGGSMRLRLADRTAGLTQQAFIVVPFGESGTNVADLSRGSFSPIARSSLACPSIIWHSHWEY